MSPAHVHVSRVEESVADAGLVSQLPANLQALLVEVICLVVVSPTVLYFAQAHEALRDAGPVCQFLAHGQALFKKGLRW